MSVNPMIVAIRLVRLLLAWVNLSFWSLLCVTIHALGARDAAWWHCAKPWGRSSRRILGVSCHIVGEEHLKGGSLFVQNHDSFSDVFTVPAILPRGTKFVMKQELAKVPFFGWGCRVGVVWVDRDKGPGAVDSISKSLADLPENWSMFIFPEGTRSKDGSVGPFKKGVVHMALKSGMPIVPIGSYGSAGIVPYRAWLIRSGPIEITVGAPIDTRAWTLVNVGQHLSEVRDAIVDLKAASRRRYEEKHGELVLEGANSSLLELRGAR